jgi:hypothetical protein
MSNFIYNSYCVEHPGVVRIYQASDERMAAIAAEHEAQSQSRSYWMVLAVVLAALAAGVFQATETWSDGHMMAAWMVLWAMAFASIALFSQPHAAPSIWCAPLPRLGQEPPASCCR